MEKNLKTSLSYITRGGAATSAMHTMTEGATLIAYAQLLGAGNIVFGLLNSIPYLGNLFHLFAAWLLTHGFSAKRISIWTTMISRPFYLFIALLVFCPNESVALTLLALFLATSHFLGCIAGGCWQPWMKSLIPIKIMGRFFAERFRWMQITKIICTLAVAEFIRHIKMLNDSYEIYAYSCLFIFAFVIGLYGAYTFFRVKDSPLPDISKQLSFFQKICLTFKDKSFRLLLFSLSSINFVYTFIYPFVTVFMLNQLKISLPTILYLTLISQLSYVLIIKKFGQIGDKWGIEKVLSLSLILTLCITLGFIFLNHTKLNQIHTFILLGIFHIMVGFATAGFNLGLNNASLQYIPNKMTMIYLSVNSVLKSVAGASGALLAGIALTISTVFSKILSPKTAIVEQISWTLFFVLCIILIAIALLLLCHLTLHLKLAKKEGS